MNLEGKIIESIKNTNYDIGFYIKDLKGNEIKYNENNIFESASCIKVFMLIEYFKQIFQKRKKVLEYFEYKKDDNIQGLNSGIISTFDYGLKRIIPEKQLKYDI